MLKRLLVSYPYIAIVILSLAVFMPAIGSVHLFDWDEINFAECAREMIVTDNYLQMQVDFQPFYEKPPLFIWLQVLSMKIFGVNEFAARFPNVLIGAATLSLLFALGKRYFSQQMAVLWCCVYACSLLPHFYFRTGIIDPLFNLCIFASCWLMLLSVEDSKRTTFALYAGIAGGLAVLTKGPVGLGLVGLTTIVSWILLRKQFRFPFIQLLTLTIIAVLMPAVWFGIDYLQHGPDFIVANVEYQWRLLTTGEAGHAQPWYYHPVVLLIGCFPASLFFFPGLKYGLQKSNPHYPFFVMMAVLFFVVLVVFSAVTTKIIHYSSMCYIPLTFFAAVALNSWLQSKRIIHFSVKIAVVLIAFVLSALAFFVPWAFAHSEWLLQLPTFKDVFLREALKQNVHWVGIEPLFGLLLLLGAILFVIWAKSAPYKSVTGILACTVIFCILFLPFVAPKIEPYTQGGMISFYKELQGKEVYIKPLTIKSYAHLFYTNKPRYLSAAAIQIPYEQWEPWLLDSATTTPVYFMCKVNDVQQWLEKEQLQEVERRGGYILLKRTTLPALPSHSH